MSENKLSVQDRFEIFEQLSLHQRCIDNGFGRESVRKYQDLYWSEGKFTVHDLRSQTFEGPDGMKQMYDYAHSVFPIDKWFHTMGPFEIYGEGDEATAKWRWIVSWREDGIGTVSTGTYTDRFQRRNGVWKCLERTSDIDPNWPSDLFLKYIDKADETFRSS
ncbi:MAG: nuclear transport factor 2 family protein [Chroococcidiopsidaceae cyanobacterium CP_BM_ER_R8_30]|nr:nuclear transport factor 2 family protein [Chroococcidiopsidaceae cyanobacterium CP_BM_ER_R8_30]